MPSPSQTRRYAAMGILRDGSLILAGGQGRLLDQAPTPEILAPGQTAWRPFAPLPSTKSRSAISLPLSNGDFGILHRSQSLQSCDFGFFVTSHADDTWKTMPAPPVDLCVVDAKVDEQGAVAVLGRAEGSRGDEPPQVWWWLPPARLWVKQRLPEDLKPHSVVLINGNGHLFLRWLGKESDTWLARLNSADPAAAPQSSFKVPIPSDGILVPRGNDTWHVSTYTRQWSWRMGDPRAEPLPKAPLPSSLGIALRNGDMFAFSSPLGSNVPLVWSKADPPGDPCAGLTSFVRATLAPLASSAQQGAFPEGYFAALGDIVSPSCRDSVNAGRSPELWGMLERGLTMRSSPTNVAPFLVLVTALQVRGASAQAVMSFRRKPQTESQFEARTELLILLARWPAADAAFTTLVSESFTKESWGWELDGAFRVAALRDDQVASRMEPVVLRGHEKQMRDFDSFAQHVCPRIDQARASEKLRRTCNDGPVERRWHRSAKRRTAIALITVGALYGGGMIAGTALSDAPDTRRAFATVSGGSTGLMVGGFIGAGIGVIAELAGNVRNSQGTALAFWTVAGAIGGSILGGYLANQAVSADTSNATTVTSVGVVLPVSTILLFGKAAWPRSTQ
ncbi:MAG: hypothetical protein SF187_05495 [Deltaproteobacteria bacterium]|nr:hypothetical protein [Deltaproteobacteria bacterium]